MNWAELFRELKALLVDLPASRFYTLVLVAVLFLAVWGLHGVH